MGYYEDYIFLLETKDAGQELLEQLRREAAQSLESDPPEVALTLVGQMIAALRWVAQKSYPLKSDMVHTINAVTEMMIQHMWAMGWHQRAVKTKDGWIYEQLPV